MPRIKNWKKEWDTKRNVKWKHTKLPKAIAVQKDEGDFWTIYYIRNYKVYGGRIVILGHARQKAKAVKKAIAWMKKHPNG